MNNDQPISASSRAKVSLILMPLFVLLFGRLGIELNVRLFPLRYSWIPSIIFYYMMIGLCLIFARSKLNIKIVSGSFFTRTIPKPHYLLIGIILPILPTLALFILNLKAVPPIFLVYIFIFAAINPFFEEFFWRGLLNNIPASRVFRIFYSSSLFAASHYFLWGSHWLLPAPKWIAAVISTFIMGILWMWFYQKQKNLFYPILSHVLVDVFNLGVAIFYGLKLITV
ncbi:MAG: CPBP family intramembrane glutamic endopeptidase [Candidatus Kryptoniota bacterium]